MNTLGLAGHSNSQGAQSANIEKTPNVNVTKRVVETDKFGNVISRTPKSIQDKMTLDAAKRGEGIVKIDNLGDPKYAGMQKMELETISTGGKNQMFTMFEIPQLEIRWISNLKSTVLTIYIITKKSERQVSNRSLMKVLCEINNILELDDSSTVERLKKYIRLSDGQLNIEKSKEYCVYGILFRDNSPWFYLCLDKDDEYPTPYPAELFNIVDGRQSSFWRLSYASYPNGVVTSSIVFDEWSKDTSFYERLLDDDPEAIKVFRKYRSLMDKE